MKKLWHRYMPNTYWGFPVEGLEESDESSSTSDAPPKGSRGIALIIAIMVIAMLMIFTSDMIINSTVNLQLSTANRDNIKSEYMAKSGANLALFLLSLDFGQDLFIYQTQKKIPTDSTSDYWAMLNGYPIGGETVEMLSKVEDSFNLSAVNDSGVLDQLKLFDGQFALMVTDEASKINLNYCIKGRAEACLGMLTDLFSCPAEKEYLTKRKIIPKALAGNIKDWVDFNKNPETGTTWGSESDPYQDRDPKVSPKNAPFDSVDELKLVAGWDDDLHTIFSPYLTVFPVPQDGVRENLKVNINTADPALLACLLPQTNFGCAEKALKFQHQVDSEGNEITPEAVSSRKDVAARLTDKFCESDQKRAEYFTYRSDVYHVTSVGVVGEQQKQIDMVILREMPDKNDQKIGFKATYKILQWKMI